MDSFYTYCNVGAFKDQLLQLGAEDLLPLTEQPKENSELILPPTKTKLNPKDIVIAWEHYETNYLKKQSDINLDDIDDDDEENGDIDIEDIIPHQFMKFGMVGQKEVHYTPWGKFENENPLSPTKLYDLQIVHFKGFKISDISSSFKDFMSKIDGIAIWGQIDQYCIIVGPAKMYDFKQVKYNLESAIYEALSLEKENSIQDLDKIYDIVHQKSLDMFNSGIENIIIIFPDTEHSIEIIENFTQEDIKSVDDLIERVTNLIVFINGENYV